MEKVKFRFAQKGDGALVLRFIKGLAAYEKLSSEERRRSFEDMMEIALYAAAQRTKKLKEK